MSAPTVKYRSGYRFQLVEPYSVRTAIVAPPGQLDPVGNDYVVLHANGLLDIRAGYAWDGASGPVQQSPVIVRGSLVHDALYQLMRECGLSMTWRPAADYQLRLICIEDGMPHWMAEMVYQAVRAFGSIAVDPQSIRPILVAPSAVEYRSAGEQEAP